MIEKVYRVNGKIFESEYDAEQYQKKIGKKVYCSGCGEFIGLCDDPETEDCEVDWDNFCITFKIDGSEWYDEHEIKPKGTKHLCYQCRTKFANQLEECQKLVEKAFDDFNLRKPEEKSNAREEMLNATVNVDNPNSMISQYIKKKDQEIMEWINENKEE